MPFKRQQLETDTEQWTGSKLEKEYTKAVHSQPYLTLTSMQSTSCEMPGYSNEAQAGIKIARRNIKNLRCADNTILMVESEEELKSLLMKVKEESEKARLKLSVQNTKIMASISITSWQKEGEQLKQ